MTDLICLVSSLTETALSFEMIVGGSNARIVSERIFTYNQLFSGANPELLYRIILFSSYADLHEAVFFACEY